MEDTLRERILILIISTQSLNPCSNGRYSQSSIGGKLTRGLNPCSNGRYSQSQMILLQVTQDKVLILVLMEDTLRVWVIKLADH